MLVVQPPTFQMQEKIFDGYVFAGRPRKQERDVFPWQHCRFNLGSAVSKFWGHKDGNWLLQFVLWYFQGFFWFLAKI